MKLPISMINQVRLLKDVFCLLLYGTICMSFFFFSPNKTTSSHFTKTFMSGMSYSERLLKCHVCAMVYRWLLVNMDTRAYGPQSLQGLVVQSMAHPNTFCQCTLYILCSLCVLIVNKERRTSFGRLYLFIPLYIFPPLSSWWKGLSPEQSVGVIRSRAIWMRWRRLISAGYCRAQA